MKNINTPLGKTPTKTRIMPRFVEWTYVWKHYMTDDLVYMPFSVIMKWPLNFWQVWEKLEIKKFSNIRLKVSFKVLSITVQIKNLCLPFSVST